mgnify:CR=1 FL=1
MMKAKVLKDFIDKNTLFPYHDGDVYENEDEARVSFLHKAGYLSKAEVETTVNSENEPPAEPNQGESATDTNDNDKADPKEDAKGGKGSKGGKKDKTDKAAGEEK